MVLITHSAQETLKLGQSMPHFAGLPGVDGNTYEANTFFENRILVFISTCHHCPYAQAYEDRLVALTNAYLPHGVEFIAINPNDTYGYPEDNMEHMKSSACEIGLGMKDAWTIIGKTLTRFTLATSKTSLRNYLPTKRFAYRRRRP